MHNLQEVMRCLLLCVCLCAIGSEGNSTNEYEMKSGTFPYMAIVYYTDDTILEDGKRFVRNAILIRPNWLLSSTIVVHGNTTFPIKTLVARAGADAIDANFTLDEEDLEQDREIIQVVQPSKEKIDAGNYDSFLSLLKTIVPFNTTSVVAPAALAEEIQDYAGKTCFIVVFGFPNNSEDQVLMKWPIEILPRDSCQAKGDNFICSIYNTSASDSNLCPRNRGGPLVCEETVVGVQTYINGCQQPHLHTAIASRREFIECGVKEQCENNPCNNICSAYDKDSTTTVGARRTSVMTTTTTTTTTTADDLKDEVKRRNMALDIENITLGAANESNFAYLKEEIKRRSDIVADNLEPDTTKEQNDELGVNVTTCSESTMTSAGTTFVRIEVPTRTVDYKNRNNSTKVLRKLVSSRNQNNEASIHILNYIVFIFTIVTVIIM